MATGRNITQRIALEGGKEIKSQLDDLGKAGQDAFKKLQDAAGASAALSRLQPILDQLRAKLEALGPAAQRVREDFAALGNSFSVVARNIALITAAVTAAATGFGALVKGAADAADSLATTAESIGLTTKELSDLRFAATQENIGLDQLTAGIGRIIQAMGAAGDETDAWKKQVRALDREFSLGRITAKDYTTRLADMRFQALENKNIFDKLGVSVKNSDGTLRKEMEVILALADAFKQMPEGAEKAALGIELFGRRQIRMIPLMNQGSDGLRKQFKEADRLAPAYNKLAEEAGKKLSDAFDKLKLSAKSASEAVLLLFAPAYTQIANALTEAISQNREHMIAFASAIAERVKPVVEDLIALLQGREGDIKNSFILQARDAMVNFGIATKNAVTGIIIPAFKLLLTVLQGVATAINAVFGTELTGGQIAMGLVVAKLIGLFGVLRAGVSLVVGVIKLLALAFGGLTVAIALIGFAIGFTLVTALLNVDWAGFAKRAQNSLASIQKAAADVGKLFSAFFRGGISEVIAEFKKLPPESQAAAKLAFDGVLAAFPLAKLVSYFSSVFTAIAATMQEKWNAVVAFLIQKWTEFVAFIGNAPANLGVVFDAVVGAIRQRFQEAILFVQLQWTNGLQAIADFATTIWAAITSAAASVGQSIANAFKSGFDSIIGFASDMLNKVLAFFDRIISAAKKASSAIASASSEGDGAARGGEVGAARGGFVRGSGTSSSDSIRAWLSNGEFVHRARAVQKYGTNFMHALNKGLIPSAAVRQLMNGFNVGGLVNSLESLMPRSRFADGGAVPAMAGGGGRPINLNIGGETFAMNANEDVAERLQRFSTKSQTRSAGRKPNWYKG